MTKPPSGGFFRRKILGSFKYFSPSLRNNITNIACLLSVIRYNNVIMLYNE